MIVVAQRFPKVGTRFAIHCTFSSYARQISAADAVADGRVADKVRARRNHSARRELKRERATCKKPL